ncbi:glutamine-synthetase adenylyltransferase [Jannaschia sp. Os4]|uniref:[protein-PII] uridylyltransferase family protein n=1 Tax=Jannaschia sp. Os4 TaxID=2807617 RepID=UPI001939DFC2|nr:glutamine-synthetase adenylyltransferase [Jannaschia sp. Os4]MBM2576615.1 glutamine-synthetase adenylyltransferase [Jannaschia sp. Os4]
MGNLLSRLTRAPLPFDPEAGRDAVATLAPPPEARALVEGTAGSAPYLAGLLRVEGEWVRALWDADPDAELSTLLGGIDAIDGPPDAPLRRAKRRMHLLAALCDLGGAWSLAETTLALTAFADAAVSAALRPAVAAQIARGRLPADDPGPAVIAMGKMGAGELNYSSDVDLILLFDEGRHDPPDYAAVRSAHVAAARAMVATLSRTTPEGYVLRTDLRLRPDPASTPLVLPMETAERYYEAMGRTWERAAWIKARACAGDVAGGEAFIARMAPFVWRRHLDFAAIEDAHAMRLAIRDAHAPVDTGVPGRDAKLGRGGIREIEFFAQTHQIVAGGRDPSLRVRGTLDALDRLEAAGLVKAAAAGPLRAAYPLLRDVEHRLQMRRDAQTHRIPDGEEGLRRLGCLLGDPGFEATLAARMEAVAEVVDPFFRPAPAAPPPTTLDPAVAARWDTYPAFRSDRARAALDRLRPMLLSRLAGAPQPEAAAAAFDGFLRGLPAGVQVMALFEANPALVDLVIDVASASAPLARFLGGNSRVLDAVLDGSFFDPLPGVPVLTAQARAAAGGDFEQALDGLRRWHREAHFRVGVHLLRGLADTGAAGRAYAALAEATVRAAWDAAKADVAHQHGGIPGLGTSVLAMGSLGPASMTAASDLDLVVLFEGGGESEGARPLGPPAWAAKATRRLVTALTAPTAEGRLYEADLRLRPSGRQGPVATSLAAFRRYQAEEAWVWELLALTRARAVAGDDATRAAAEAARAEALGQVGEGARIDRAAVLAGLAEMRARLAAAGQGPGGPRDVELAAQANALCGRIAARDVPSQLAEEGWLDLSDREALAATHLREARIRQLARLADPEDGAEGLRFAAARLGMSGPDALMAETDARRADAAGRIARALARAGAAD